MIHGLGFRSLGNAGSRVHHKVGPSLPLTIKTILFTGLTIQPYTAIREPTKQVALVVGSKPQRPGVPTKKAKGRLARRFPSCCGDDACLM